MKFLFAVHGWYLGGFATFCRNLTIGLQDRSHQVDLLVLPDVQQKYHLPPGLFQRSLVLSRGLGRLGRHVARVARAIDRLNPEVLVLNDSAYAMAALPFIRRTMVRLPVVHSIAPDEVELGISNSRWWDRLLAVSELVGQAVAAKGIGPRVSVCPLGVPIPKAVSNRRRGPADQPIRIMSVTRVVVHQKRIDRLPAIARLLASRQVAFHWTVLGDGEYLPRLRKELRGSGLAKHFSLKGAVPQAQVVEALGQAEVFVLTSDCEGMPQALLEAMAQGVVPVVSRIPGSTTCLVHDQDCGYLCDPACAGDFANAIAELARTPGILSEMSERASRLIAQQFSLARFCDRFLEVVAQTQAHEAMRPVPISASALPGAHPTFRCLGFWPSLRHQSLGRFKRWLRPRAAAALSPGWPIQRQNV